MIGVVLDANGDMAVDEFNWRKQACLLKNSPRQT